MEPIRRPPTAGELSALSDEFQRNPAMGFVELGEAYLALGRPQEAIEIGAQGLRSAPDNAQGRIMVARAFSFLHQWKEAQAELLKVVKAHRNHIEGFRMLGEVLMRRSDYERAIPVLLHAQNLSPADPDVVTLLRQARAGESLGPPPPIPVPVAPKNGGPSARAADPMYAPTASPAYTPSQAFDEPPRKPLTQSQSRPRGLGPNEVAQGPGQVRPRVMSNQKQFGAAQASLRMSAAVGEGHLPGLLSQGLVAIPNVKAQRIDYRIAPVRRFGRSLVQVLSILGVVVLLCGGGAAAWYFLSQRIEVDENAKALAKAEELLKKGTQGQLIESTDTIKGVLKTNAKNPRALSLYALNMAMRASLFGDVDDAEVKNALAQVDAPAKDAKSKGHREAVLAVTLGASLNLKTERAKLPAYVATLEMMVNDPLANWIAARGYLALGNRSQARKALEKAHQSPSGLPWASLDLADFNLDEGDFEGALSIYNKLLEKDPKPELAYLGRALTRAEQALQSPDAMNDISVGLAKLKGVRADAKRTLALVAANLALDDFDAAAAELKKVTEVDDVRWLARVGLYHLRLGHVAEAEATRKRIAETHPEVESDPLVRVLDAEIHWFHGRPRRAIERLDGAGDARAHLVRGKALFDRRMYADAAKEFAGARESAPEDRQTRVWSEATRLILAEQNDERQKAMEALDALVLDSHDHAARLPTGLAYLAIGDYSGARRKLEKGVVDLTDEDINSMLARTRVALAQALLFEGKSKEAAAQAELAAKELPSYAGADGVSCRALARLKDAKAVDVCGALVKEGNPDADVLAAYAVVLAQQGKRDEAIATLKKAKEAGASEPELQWAIKEIDPKLFDELGVAKPR